MAPLLGRVAKLRRWVTHELPTYVLRAPLDFQALFFGQVEVSIPNLVLQVPYRDVGDSEGSHCVTDVSVAQFELTFLWTRKGEAF
nr:unnamed protein product [Haemonchus contortus]